MVKHSLGVPALVHGEHSCKMAKKRHLSVAHNSPFFNLCVSLPFFFLSRAPRWNFLAAECRSSQVSRTMAGGLQKHGASFHILPRWHAVGRAAHHAGGHLFIDNQIVVARHAGREAAQESSIVWFNTFMYVAHFDFRPAQSSHRVSVQYVRELFIYVDNICIPVQNLNCLTSSVVLCVCALICLYVLVIFVLHYTPMHPEPDNSNKCGAPVQFNG